MSWILLVLDGANAELALRFLAFDCSACAVSISTEAFVVSITSIFDTFTDLESDELLGDATRRRRVFLDDFSRHVWFVFEMVKIGFSG